MKTDVVKLLLPAPRKIIRKSGELSFRDREAVRVCLGVSTISLANIYDALRFTGRQRKISFPALVEISKAKSCSKTRFAPKMPAYIKDKQESYLLKISDRISIAAADSTGLAYALTTLDQLLGKQGHQVTFPRLQIEDSPAVKYRGLVHNVGLGIPPEQHERTISLAAVKYMVDLHADFKMNVLVIHFENGLEITSRKNFSARCAFPQKDMRKLIAYAARKNVHIMPAPQLFGHWSPSLAKYYSQLSCGGQGNNFCPNNEAVYLFIKKICAEVAELFPFEYIHLGCDEVASVGDKCPRCAKDLRTIGKAGLFAKHVNRLAKIIKSLGKKPAIWGDMVMDTKHSDIIKYLDKDITLFNWNYLPDPDMAPGIERPTALRELENNGIAVALAPAISCMENIYPAHSNHLRNIAGMSQRAKHYKNIVGIFGCAWCWEKRFLEDLEYSSLFTAETSWNLQNPDMGLFNRKLGWHRHGADSPAIARSQVLLGQCNTYQTNMYQPSSFELRGVFQDFWSYPVFAKPGYAEKIFCLKTMARRAEEVLSKLPRLKKIAQCDTNVLLRMEYAARRYRYTARSLLWIEEAKELYQEVERLQYTIWDGARDKRVPANPGKLRHHLRRILAILRTLENETIELDKFTDKVFASKPHVFGITKRLCKEYCFANLQNIRDRIARLKCISGNYLRSEADPAKDYFPTADCVAIFSQPLPYRINAGSFNASIERVI